MHLRPSRLLASLALATLGSLPFTSHAAMVFDNGAPDNSPWPYEMTHWAQADDFTLAAETSVGRFQFWSLEWGSAYQGSITWSIYSDASGTLGSELYSGTSTTVDRFTTGVSVDGGIHPFTEVRNTITLDAPITLTAGTYWLALHNGDPEAAPEIPSTFWFAWETTSTGSGALAHENEYPLSDGTWVIEQDETPQLAFNVSSVPEPSSFALLLPGLAVLLRRRRK